MGNHDFEGDDVGIWMEEGRLLRWNDMRDDDHDDDVDGEMLQASDV